MAELKTADGRRLHYSVEGPQGAPWLLLSNSLGTSRALWGPQMEALRSRFRVLRYEHRGHGGAPATPGPYALEDLGQDALGLMDAVGAEAASVCGVSLGGLVALWLAVHAPERVEKLVLACTAPSFPPPEAWGRRAALVRREGVSTLLEGLLERWFTPGAGARAPKLSRLVEDMLARVNAEGYAACCEALASADLWGDIGGVRAPTLIMAGAEDPVSPPDTAQTMQAKIPGASLVVLAGAAHLANLEQADRFTDALLQHLVGTPVARGMAVRRQVLGNDHVDRAQARRTPFNAPFQDLITRYAWGEIWTRPGLDRHTRRGLTIAMMVALGRFEEMRMHVKAALADDFGPEEIQEILLQAAVYCGVPAANTAFAIAQDVLSEMEIPSE